MLLVCVVQSLPTCHPVEVIIFVVDQRVWTGRRIALYVELPAGGWLIALGCMRSSRQMHNSWLFCRGFRWHGRVRNPQGCCKVLYFAFIRHPAERFNGRRAEVARRSSQESVHAIPAVW